MTSSRRHRSGWGSALWTPDGRPQHLTSVLIAGIGMVLIVAGWIDASGETHFRSQLSAVNVSVLGTVLVLGACAFHLLGWRRAVRSRTAPLVSLYRGAGE